MSVFPGANPPDSHANSPDADRSEPTQTGLAHGELTAPADSHQDSRKQPGSAHRNNSGAGAQETVSAPWVGTATSHHSKPTVYPGAQQPTIAFEKRLPYHRLSFAYARSRWFSPLLEGLLGVAIFMVLAIMGAVVFSLITVIHSRSMSNLAQTLETLQSRVLIDPVVMIYVFGTNALMIPALFLARLVCGPKPLSLVHSVLGRIRWSLLGIACLLGLVCYGTYYLAALGMDGFSTLGFYHHQPAEPVFWVFILLSITIIPLQCYAEELVFRGYLMQTIGRWLKHPAWAIILPAPLFMIGHAYDLWGQASVLAMGLIAGFLCWYTGGLEAGIGMHIMNNVLTVFMGMFAGADPFAQGGSSPEDFALGVAVELAYAVLMCLYVRYKGYERTGLFSVNTVRPHLA